MDILRKRLVCIVVSGPSIGVVVGTILAFLLMDLARVDMLTRGILIVGALVMNIFAVLLAYRASKELLTGIENEKLKKQIEGAVG